MTEYAIHFQKGTRVGTRSLRMVQVEANTAQKAISIAKRQFDEPGYRLIRVDHFDENGHLVIDV